MSIDLVKVLILHTCLCETVRAQCENTDITRNFGEISYLPPATKDTDGQRCSWTFSPSTANEDFIFIVKFNYLASYDNNDQIQLPDGSLLPHRGIVFGSEGLCKKFVLIGSQSLPCLDELKDEECPGADITPIHKPIRVSLSSVPQFRPPSKLVYFTNFQLSYVFAFCLKDRTTIPGNYSLMTDDLLLQFENQNNTFPVNYTTAIVLFIVFVILSAIVTWASLKHRCNKGGVTDSSRFHRSDSICELSNRSEREVPDGLIVRTEDVIKDAQISDRKYLPQYYRRVLELNEKPRHCSTCRDTQSRFNI